jgi:hypothetical protein
VPVTDLCCNLYGINQGTTRISGLRQAGFHSDFAFDPSMSALPIIDAEVPKCWAVHPPIGNVSWV